MEPNSISIGINATAKTPITIINSLPAIGTAPSSQTSIAAAKAASDALTLAKLEFLYFNAISLYRRRNYEKCVEVCNILLQDGQNSMVQMFSDNRPGPLSTALSMSMPLSGVDDGSRKRYGSNLQRPNAQGIGDDCNSGGGGARRRRRLGHGNANSSHHSGGNGSSSKASVLSTWMMEGVWQLKMRALTQRVYVDDLETDDINNPENEEIELQRIATAARPGTSISLAFRPRTATSLTYSKVGSGATQRGHSEEKSKGIEGAVATRATRTSTTSGRTKSGILRPGTAYRPCSSLISRPATTASKVRATSAAAFSKGDATASLYQASRFNPTIYAEHDTITKPLFLFLYYHLADVEKSYSLCEAVLEVQRQKRGRIDENVAATSPAHMTEWWWDQQMGRCLLMMRQTRKAEKFLLNSLSIFPHPDTYLMLSRLYKRLHESGKALELINSAVDRYPFDVTYRVEQGRIYDALSKSDDAVQIYRLITKLNPINVEALASIAVHYFYDNNPEMALMYYKRILSLGMHTPELYCNIGLCCLYGGQIDMILPCFQRAMSTAKTPVQKSDVWYNASFVAISTGDFKLARRCLQLSVFTDTRHAAALNNLAVLAAHTGDMKKSKTYLKAANDLISDCEEIEKNLEYIENRYNL